MEIFPDEFDDLGCSLLRVASILSRENTFGVAARDAARNV